MEITIDIDESLLSRAEILAAAEGRTLADLIEEGLRLVVDRRTAADGDRHRRPVRVSKQTGGVMPGVDLTRFSDYQETEDLEYIERLKNFK